MDGQGLFYSPSAGALGSADVSRLAMEIHIRNLWSLIANRQLACAACFQFQISVF